MSAAGVAEAIRGDLRRPLRYLLQAIPLASVLPLSGCSSGEEVRLGEGIEMGAFVFAVERAREDVKSRSGGRYKDIEVVIRLENYEERFQPTFDDAFNGYRPGSMMSFPKMSLIDADGHAFDGFVSPVSGGSRRSQRWIVRFSLVYGSLRESLDTDWQESAEEHVGKEIADFRLVIKNPDHRPGQPRQVWVQL